MGSGPILKTGLKIVSGPHLLLKVVENQHPQSLD